MPIYEYYCKSCDKKFEVLILGKEKTVCPECNAPDVKRVMSACGFLSRGPGGKTVSSSAGASSCGGCTSSDCSSCGS